MVSWLLERPPAAPIQKLRTKTRQTQHPRVVKKTFVRLLAAGVDMFGTAMLINSFVITPIKSLSDYPPRLLRTPGSE